jgi:uncharacterized protein
MRLLPFLLLLLSLISLPAVAFADAWSDRMEVPAITSDDDIVEAAMRVMYDAIGSKDFDAAQAKVQALADAGNAEATFRLGRYYDIETPVPDYPRAIALYEKAASLGHGWAANNLGVLYERGAGVDKDVAKARTYYEESAKAGDHHGYLNLARLYFEGGGGAPDPAKGLATLEAAMNRKIPGIFLDASNIYQYGLFGVQENRAKALEYLREGAALKNEDAADRLAYFTLYGDCDPDAGLLARRRGSAVCVPANPIKGFDMIESLASKDNKEAVTDLGSAYWVGAGTERDPFAAIKYWKEAGAMGDCRAWDKLTSAYKDNKYITRNDDLALEFLKQAAACNPRDGNSLYYLGRHYVAASSAEHDCVTAEHYFQRAVANGARAAYTDLGFVYERGCDPIAPDKKKAFEYYLIGAKLDVVLSQNNLGVMLKHGWGVDKDLSKGFAWISVAAAKGSSMAKRNLNEFQFILTKDQRKQAQEAIPAVRQLIAETKINSALAFDGKY